MYIYTALSFISTDRTLNRRFVLYIYLEGDLHKSNNYYLYSHVNQFRHVQTCVTISYQLNQLQLLYYLYFN